MSLPEPAARSRWSADAKVCSGNNIVRPAGAAIVPSYTQDWGFADGAQNDIFTPAADPAGVANLGNKYAGTNPFAPGK